MAGGIEVTFKEYKPEELEGLERDYVVRLYEQLLHFEVAVAQVEVGLCPEEVVDLVDELIINMERCIVGFWDDQPVAFLTVDNGEPTSIAGLFVVPHARCKGVGEEIIEIFQLSVSGNDLQVVCFVGNLRAMKFYERMGFVFKHGAVFSRGTRRAV